MMSLVDPRKFTCRDPKVWVVDEQKHLTHGFRTYCRAGSIIPIGTPLRPAKGKRKLMLVCSDCLEVAKIRGEFKA